MMVSHHAMANLQIIHADIIIERQRVFKLRNQIRGLKKEHSIEILEKMNESRNLKIQLQNTKRIQSSLKNWKENSKKTKIKMKNWFMN